MAWLFVKVVRYPALDTYHGTYDGVIVEFKTPPDQIPFMDNLGEWLADRVPKEAAKKGVTPLKLRVLKDTDPLWTTHWQVEFWGHGSPLDPVTLAACIIGALAAVAIVFFSWQIIKSFSGLWQATPQELEREEGREEFVEKLINEYNYTPEQIREILEGTKAPPAGVELPEGILPEWVAPVAIGGGVLLLGLVAVAATRRG
ncbi:hypothetical protein ES705_28962 [subsurface metagenome]